MGRKRTCELPFCKGIVEGTKNKRRCERDRNIHLHRVISKSVRKIMRYIEGREDFTANDVNRDLFKERLDKNEKGSMYRLFQAMVREQYLFEHGKREGLKVYAINPQAIVGRDDTLSDVLSDVPSDDVPPPVTVVGGATDQSTIAELDRPTESSVTPAPILTPREQLQVTLREFVHAKNGFWNHHDWMELINRPDIRNFSLPDAEIGMILEEEKTKYWAHR